jgi:uncharacterized Zn-binding protein involved in type VI secretion
MPSSVKVNGTTNSLVHKGSNGLSKATLPDVCKTPTPGGPVPMPYPNIAQAATLAKGTSTVKADGMMIAIKGSEFSLSNGDEAGTVGGVKSNTFMKEATWLLYSFDVKMEGSNACRLSDKMFHNHENTVNAMGVGQPDKRVREVLDCGESGSYGDLKKKTGKNQFDRDHVPSKAALKERARKLAASMGKRFTEEMGKAVDNLADAIAIPKALHQQHSESYGQSAEQAQADGASTAKLNAATKRDLKAIEENMKDHMDAKCRALYAAWAQEIRDKIDEDPNYFDKFLKAIIRKT